MELVVSLDRVSPVPLYHQLAHQIRSAISDGSLSKGSFLGNEIALAENWQVSRPTVRRAIQDLVDEGLLVRRRGVGTQVVNDEVRRQFTLTSLHDDLSQSGVVPTTQVLVAELVPADDEVATALEVPVGTQIMQLVRLRLADGRPLGILRNWLIESIASDITAEMLTESGLYQLLRDRGVRPHFARQRLGAKVASADEAALLHLSAGDALLTMRRVMQDDSGQVIELGQHVYDAAHYAVETSVVES